MRRTSDIALRLIMSFDNARRAFDLEAKPGWVRASAELREALNDARAVNDVDTLPCPLSWWVATQAAVRTWLEAPSADVRRGLTDAANAVIRALSRYATHEIAEPEAPHGRGVG